jgi:hypothetical protein
MVRALRRAAWRCIRLEWIAPSEVACSNLFLRTISMANEPTDTVRLHHSVMQLNATLDHHPDRRKMIAKHGFGFGLRDEQNEWKASIGHAEVAKTRLGGATVVEVNEKASAGITASDQPLCKSQSLKYFQAASCTPSARDS